MEFTYKIGQTLTITDTCPGDWHGFNVGDKVTVVDIDDTVPHTDKDNKRYRVNDKIKSYWVSTQGLSQLNSIDYTSCHPTIKENLQNNIKTYCKVWDNDIPGAKQKMNIIGYVEHHYTDKLPRYVDEMGVSWEWAEPIVPKMRVKKASALTKWFKENGWVPNRTHFSSPDNKLIFNYEMFQYCGKEPHLDWDWIPEWLEAEEENI